MRKIVIILSFLLVISLFGCSLNKNKQDRIFKYRIANKDEAMQYYQSNDDYFNSLSEYDIQYRTQNINGTIEDLKKYGCTQMSEFTDIEIETLNSAMDELEMIIKESGYHLPEIDEIVFIKSTQNEEGGSVAYTHGTQIYMNNILPLYLRTGKQNHQKGLSVLAHEIFHCLTRCNKDFRKEMYDLINFSIADKEYDIEDDIKRITISNPDVEHHDAFATFTINGEKKDCYMLNICTKPFENKGDQYSDHYKFILVPINKQKDDKDNYFIEEFDDYWNVFGENTKYIADPEECMADNFGYALVYGLDGMKYSNPEIIQGIINSIR